jgi:trigger factor
MNISITKEEKSIVEASVELDGKPWQDELEKAYKKLAKDIQVDGFRKGKAPLDLAKKQINPGKAINDAIDNLLSSAYQKVLEQHDLSPILRPEVRVNKADEEGVSITFVITINPDVTLGVYRDLEVKKAPVEITEQEITQELFRVQQQCAEVSPRESGVIEKGDTVIFDFDGYVNGEAFEGGKAEKFELEIGSNRFVPGFEDQMIGLKRGDDTEVKVTFPENYVQELAGKEAIFKLKIHEVNAKTLPPIDDNLALDANIEGVANLEELRNHLTADLKTKKSQEVDRAAFNELIDLIVANATLEVPQTMIDADIEHSYEHFKEDIEKKGIPFDKYCEITGYNEAGIKESLGKDVERNLKAMFVLSAIAKDNNIEVGEADLEAEYQLIANQYSMPLEEVKNALKDRSNDILNQLFSKKIGEFLTSINRIQ